MTNTKKLFILLFIALSSVSAFAQLSSTADDKQLDFLIGEWELFSNEGILIGENAIELIGGTHTFEESFKGFDGFNTQSTFKYDTNKNKWLQDWSDDFGTNLQFEGKLSNNKLTLNATSIDGNGNKIGEVTSGTMSPSLGKGIGLGYVPTIFANLNSKINIQTGIRLEQFNLVGVFSNTQQANIEPIKNQIFNIYPSVHITYLPSDKNQFQIGFSRRVDRPSITQVTPIQEWNSPLSISMGNRNLVPQYTNSIELNYTKTISKGYISLGTFYRKTKNIIGRIFNTDASNTDRQILSYTNYDSAESYGFEFSSRFKPLKWWTLRPSANLYIQDNQGFINNILSETNNTFFKARISNNLKASDRLRFSFSTSYRGKNQSVLAKIEDYFLVNIAAKYYILNKNGAITLRGTDIFDGYKLDFTTTNPFSQTGQFTLEYSAIYLGFSYNFGNGKNRERDRKYREENETQSSGGVL